MFSGFWFIVSLDAYKWLVCRLLMDSEKKLQEQLASGKDGFTARNDSQAYFCNTLALVYIEVRLDSLSIKVCMQNMVTNYYIDV